MSTTPTPITDAALCVSFHPNDLHGWPEGRKAEFGGEHIVPARVCRALERQLAEVTEQRDQLERWKREQLAVDGSWDPQEVGRLLGMTLGADIRANIKPGIEKLIAQRDMLADALESLIRCWDRDETPQGSHRQQDRKALAAVKGGQA